MKPEEYTQECLKTVSCDFDAIRGRMKEDKMLNVLHGLMGLCTESAEALDMMKKHVYYGKAFDLVNLKEELGDVLWYCSIIINEIGSSYEEIMQININKLRARYGEKFSEGKAITRDLDQEVRAMEDGDQ